MKGELKLWPSDKFFYDSPNAGEPECICSRCHTQILESEKVYRVALDESMFFSRHKDGSNQQDAIIPPANGLEFRLCNECFNEFVKP
jgi:hypothetical protein